VTQVGFPLFLCDFQSKNAEIAPFCVHFDKKWRGKPTAVSRPNAGKCIEPDGLEAIKHDINLWESLLASCLHSLPHILSILGIMSTMKTAGVPMIQFVAGREKPHLPGQAFPCRGVPTGSQRHRYDFVTANETRNNDLWWYLACFSDGDCCAGPQHRPPLPAK